MDPKIPTSLVALLGLAQSCVGPCLSLSPKETGDYTSDTGIGPCLTTSPRDSDTATVGPCLSPPPPPETGDTGIGGTGDTGVGDTGGDTGAGDTGAGGTGAGGSAADTAAVRARVVASGRLPADVARRLSTPE